MPTVRLARAAAFIACCTMGTAVTGADVQSLTGSFDGVEVRYRVLLPDDFDASKQYPAVLHFAGGPQTWDIVERSTDTDWRPLVDAHGIIVVSPAATNGQLYFERGDRIFPEFIEHVLRTYPVLGGKLHVTGHSNGGLSAYHIASLYPQHFISVTGYPGLLRRLDDRAAEALAPLCLYMHVGDDDPSWRDAMRQQAGELAARGLNIEFVVEADQPHRLDTGKDDLRARLHAEIEASRRGCGDAGR